MNERNEVNLKRETAAAVVEVAFGGGKTRGKPGPSVTMNEIHRLAYRKWNAAGRPSGDSTRFWLEAEQELVEGT